MGWMPWHNQYALARSTAFESAHILIGARNHLISAWVYCYPIGAFTTVLGREYHWLMILLERKWCLTSNLDLTLNSLNWWPLVVVELLRVKWIQVVVTVQYFMHFNYITSLPSTCSKWSTDLIFEGDLRMKGLTDHQDTWWLICVLSQVVNIPCQVRLPDLHTIF